MRLTEFLPKLDSHFERMIEFFKHATPDTPVDSLQVNPCGECVACCIFPSITAHQFSEGRLPPTKTKPFGEKCRYCTGNKCSVYDARPVTCKSYLCLYALGLVDESPKLAGMTWVFEPDVGASMGLALVGHCHDLHAMLNNVDRMTEMLQLMSVNHNGVPVLFTVIRSNKAMCRIRYHHNALIADIADVIQEGLLTKADLKTLRGLSLTDTAVPAAYSLYVEQVQELANLETVNS